MEAAENFNLSQTVNEQGNLLHQHPDQLAQLGLAMEEAPGRHFLHLAEDTLQPVDPVSQSISPFINPLKSPIPIYPSQINMTVHHPNAFASYFNAHFIFTHQMRSPTTRAPRLPR